MPQKSDSAAARGKARKDARSRAERLRIVGESLAASAEGVMVVDAEDFLVSMNDAGSRIIERALSPDEPVQEQVLLLGLRYANGQPLSSADAPVFRALRGESVASFVTRHNRLDGSEIVLSSSANPIFDDQHRIIGAISLFRDITAQAREEQTAQSLVALNQEISERLMLAALEAQTGLEREQKLREELQSQSGEIQRQQEDLQSQNELLRQMNEKAVVTSLEVQETLERERSLREELQRQSLEMQTQERELLEHNDELRGLNRALLAVEKDLAESEARYRAIGELIPYGVWICDVEGNCAYVSDSFLGMAGVGLTDCQRYGWTNLLPPEDRAETAGAWRAYVEKCNGGSNELWECEHRMRDRNGEYRAVLARGVPMRDAEGRIKAFVGTHLDLTDRKKAETDRERLLREIEKLARSVEKERDVLKVIMDNTRACLVYLDPQFNFVQVNPAYVAGCGRSEAELLGRNHFDLYPHAENQAIFERVRDAGEAAEFLAKPFDFPDEPWRGTTYWDWTLSPVKSGDGELQGLVFSLVDVTERVRDRQRLQELVAEAERRAEELEFEQARWRATVESIPELVTVCDAQGRVTYISPLQKDLFGYELRPELPMSEYPTAYGTYRPDGTAFEIEELPLQRAALRGEEPRDVEIVLRFRSGIERSTLWDASPIRDASERVVGAVAVGKDITVRKEAEKFREEYISLVSHDLRAPLTVMIGHAKILRRRVAKLGDATLISSAEAIRAAGQRMDSMLQDLVDSVGLESGSFQLKPQSLSLAYLVSGVLERAVSPQHAHRISVEPVGEVPTVEVDPDRMERVLANLLTNALKYSPNDSPVEVRLGTREEGVIVAIADRGAGIPEEDLPHLFDRFYRSKRHRKSEGLGLGLYISKMVVEAHGGRIWVESELGRGSTFYVSLPAG